MTYLFISVEYELHTFKQVDDGDPKIFYKITSGNILSLSK